MKKRILFSLMAMFMLSLTFVSCGDDDDDDAVDYKTAIVGKWKCTHDVEYTDGKVDRDRDVSAWNEFIEYKSDGTYVWTDGDGHTDKGTWSVSGDKLTEVDSDGDSDVCTISISGNTLTVTDEYTEDGHTYKDVATYTKQ